MLVLKESFKGATLFQGKKTGAVPEEGNTREFGEVGSFKEEAERGGVIPEHQTWTLDGKEKAQKTLNAGK